MPTPSTGGKNNADKNISPKIQCTEVIQYSSSMDYISRDILNVDTAHDKVCIEPERNRYSIAM
jgi:hypothetical protein